MYTSTRRPLPERGQIDAEVELAWLEWAPIPTDKLSRACARARLEAGGFPATNAQVLNAYRAMRREAWVEKGSRERNRLEEQERMASEKRYLEGPGSAPPHPDWVSQFMEDLRKAVKP